MILECAQTDEPLACRFEGAPRALSRPAIDVGTAVRSAVVEDVDHPPRGDPPVRGRTISKFSGLCAFEEEPLAPVEVGHRSATLMPYWQHRHEAEAKAGLGSRRRTLHERQFCQSPAGPQLPGALGPARVGELLWGGDESSAQAVTGLDTLERS